MENANETKKRILNTAVDLFKKQSFEAVTINQICQASGISKHTFYYYFTSKEDLVFKYAFLPDPTSEQLLELLLVESPYQQYKQIFRHQVNHLADCGRELIRHALTRQLNRIVDYDPNQEAPIGMRMRMDLLAKAQANQEIANTSNPQDLLMANFTILFGLCHVWATSSKVEFDLWEGFNNLTDCLMMSKEYNKDTLAGAIKPKKTQE